MPGAIYGRWAPPKAAAPTQPPASVTGPEDIPGERSNAKKQKSRRRDDRVAAPVKTPDAPKEHADITSKDVEEQLPKSSKKPKKRKREAVIDDAPNVPKKHKSVLAKFDKVARRAEAEAQDTQDAAEEAGDKHGESSEVILRDLEPLPQPAPVPDAAFEPTFSVLPRWLEQPVTVDASKRVPFDDLGVQPFFSKRLEKQGYTDALAVQSALLPMLHPGHEQHLGDICVSAKTGSGKTLAYLLPIIEALKNRVTTVLSAIVIVPSRSLVDQALRVAEELCAGTKIKVGTAVGSVPFATEQKQLVKIRSRYDPKRAEALNKRAAHQLETGFVERGGIMADLMTMPIDHVPRYDSGVDILICTPGRLVEHIESTTGFLLRSLRWLVIDEADQLLNQNFQGWTTVLMDALHSETPADFMNAQEKLRKQRRASAWGDAIPTRRRITKIVLSATMESDLTKLGTLRLKRPKLVSVLDAVEGEPPLATDGDVFELPAALDELAVSVGDGQKKPLYLLYLLLNYAFKDSEGETDSPSIDNQPRSIAGHQSRVLVFTKSNESASRLSHLLSVLEPSLKEYLKTMTPSSTAKETKKLLRSFASGSIKILIASDAASRGLDIPGISQVVNYDIPSSVTSYVHRIGRTARAGKAGQAWTLVTKTEAAWFWNQLARGDSIRRGGKKVKRIEWSQWNVTYNRKRTYDAALTELQEAVEGAETAM